MAVRIAGIFCPEVENYKVCIKATQSSEGGNHSEKAVILSPATPNKRGDCTGDYFEFSSGMEAGRCVATLKYSTSATNPLYGCGIKRLESLPMERGEDKVHWRLYAEVPTINYRPTCDDDASEEQYERGVKEWEFCNPSTALANLTRSLTYLADQMATLEDARAREVREFWSVVSADSYNSTHELSLRKTIQIWGGSGDKPEGECAMPNTIDPKFFDFGE